MRKLIILLVVAFGFGLLLHAQNTRYRLEKDVNIDTVSDLIQKIDEASKIIVPTEHFDLILGTPGGDLNQTFRLIKVISESGIAFNTHIDFETASAGAILFLQGKKRSMSKDATILFHTARVFYGGTLITQDLIERHFREENIPEKKTLDKIPKEELIYLRQKLEEYNIKVLKAVEKVVGLKVSLKLIVKGKDVVLNAKEALELGVISQIKEAIHD